MILDTLIISTDISFFPAWAKDRNIKSITPACYTDDEIQLDLERQIWRLGFFKEYVLSDNGQSTMDFFVSQIRSKQKEAEVIYYLFDVEAQIEYEYFQVNLHNDF